MARSVVVNEDIALPQAAERGHVTRAFEVVLDPSPAQERWLRSSVGSMRVAYNWALEQVADGLEVRRDERARGVPEDGLTLALKDFSEPRSGKRRGEPVGFPRFKDRHSRPKAQQAAGRDRRSEVAWLHTMQPETVREVWQMCDTGRARIQALTIKHAGCRWKAVLRLRLLDGTTRLRNPGEPVRHHGGAIGVDVGLKHLVTLDRPIPGLTDEHGHVPNPRVLEAHLARLRRLDRAIARCEKGSKNRTKLLRRRAKLHGRIVATRERFLHELSRRLAGGFDLVCIEDLNVAGMARRKGLRNGRSVAEASMGELTRQLDYKTSDRDVNAARNIRAEGQRLMSEQQHVASILGETRNGEPRPGETEPAQHHRAGGHGSFEAATDPAAGTTIAVA